MEKKFLCFDIQWDADEVEDLESMPTEIEVTISDSDNIDTTDGYELSEFLSDKITEETGFCHDGFLYKDLN